MESNNGNKLQNNNNNDNKINIYNINTLLQKLRIDEGLSVGKNDSKENIIFDKASRISNIRNTNLELLPPLTWDSSSNNKIKIERGDGISFLDNKLVSYISDGYIRNNHINNDAAISMSKTNFSPNIDQFTYNGITGDLMLNDIYVNNTGDLLFGNYTISGFLTITGQKESLSLKGNNNGILMNMYQKSTDLNKSFTMGYPNNNDTDFVFQNLLNTGHFIFNKSVAINKDSIEPNVALDISGDSHIKGTLTIDIILLLNNFPSPRSTP